MPLSIIIPLPPDSLYYRDGRGSLGTPNSPITPSEDSESLCEWQSCHSHGMTSPVSTASQTQFEQSAPSRKSSTSSLPIFNRRPPLTPPVVHWCPSPGSPTTSSSTLVESSRGDNDSAGYSSGVELRAHLQTCLDENRLANRSLTMNNAVLQCAELKGFQDHTMFQSDASFQQLLVLSTTLDFALENPNHDGLYEIVQGVVKGVDELLEKLEDLPFDLRSVPSFILGTSDILQAGSALLHVAGQLKSQDKNTTLHQVVERCQYERDRLLRAVRVLFDIADLESKLQAKQSIKPSDSPEPSPKRKFKFRLSRRQSTNTRPTKPPEPSDICSSGEPGSEDNDADDEEDEYEFHVAMVSDILPPQDFDQYWGVRIPDPVGDDADIVVSEEDGSLQGASLAAVVYFLTDPQPYSFPINVPDLRHTLLLYFRAVGDPVDLAKALISRFEEQPVDLNCSQRESWPLYQSLKCTLVARFIETWIDYYWIPDRDRIAGLHIKDFVLQAHQQFEPRVRDKILRELDKQREVAITLADSAGQLEPTIRRVAHRQKRCRYQARLRERVEKLVQMVPQPEPTDEDVQSAKALDDLIGSMDGGTHILALNSHDLSRELARQLALFMSDGYRRVIPEELWYRLGLGIDSDADTARSIQQAYESALSSWVTGTILEQVEANTRAAVMTFFIALGLRSHEYCNYSAMSNIHDGLTHSCIQSLSETRLPLSKPARLALERLCELKKNVESIALSEKGATKLPRPAVPVLGWYFSALGTAINAKPFLESPNTFAQIPNMNRCLRITSIISEMELWHVPYMYPRADNVQAWLLKCLEGVIARDAERGSNWVFKQSEAIEQTGRPESTKHNLKLPRLSNPFGKKPPKAEWREATILELLPRLRLEG